MKRLVLEPDALETTNDRMNGWNKDSGRQSLDWSSFQYMTDEESPPLQDVSAVVSQVTAPNELWDLDGFGHS